MLAVFPLKLHSAFITLNHTTTASLVSQIHYPSISDLPYQARQSDAATPSHTCIHTIPCLPYEAIASLTPMSHNWYYYACPIVVHCCISRLVGPHFFSLIWRDFLIEPPSRISNVTAIWNTNAFCAYLMNIRLHNAKIQMVKLSAVLLACVGVLFVVYGGQSASSDLAPSSFSTSTNPNITSSGSAALIGNLLTLIASIGYAAYQVLYRRFVALPSDPDKSISAPSSPIARFLDMDGVRAPLDGR